MTKSFPRMAHICNDPFNAGVMLDPDAVRDNLDAWLAGPERELAKLTASLPRGMHGVTMMATEPQQSPKTQMATAPQPSPETRMMRESRERHEARRKRMTDSLSASAMAVSDEVMQLLTRR